MKYVSFFFLYFTLVNCFSYESEFFEGNLNKPKIVGGRNVNITEVPYQAQIIDEDDTLCGATIISPEWLVSAAHCFTGEPENLQIITGSSVSKIGELHEIETYIIHPNYKPFIAFDNDVALIKLKNPMVFNDKQKAIPLANKPPRVGSIMRISGYGWESLRKRRQFSERPLKAVDIKVVNYESCLAKYRRIYVTLTKNSFCAGLDPENGSGSCSRDSGGPGVINGKLAGIVSGGYECSTTYFPGIYTRVDLFRNWISNLTGLKV